MFQLQALGAETKRRQPRVNPGSAWGQPAPPYQVLRVGVRQAHLGFQLGVFSLRKPQLFLHLLHLRRRRGIGVGVLQRLGPESPYWCQPDWSTVRISILVSARLARWPSWRKPDWPGGHTGVSLIDQVAIWCQPDWPGDHIGVSLTTDAAALVNRPYWVLDRFWDRLWARDHIGKRRCTMSKQSGTKCVDCRPYPGVRHSRSPLAERARHVTV